MVTNNINGKVYIGSHSWDGEGLDPNYYGSGKIIKQAVKKYGKKNFQVEVLYFYDTVEECRADEERILTEYDVKNCPHSYNCKNSAIGSEKGLKHSEETKQKISQIHKGKTVSDETRQKIAQARKGKRGKGTPNYGKHHTDETRKKMSQAHKGKTVSEETRKKLSQALKGENHPMYGKHLSEETKQKLSQALKGKNKGKTFSEEHRKNLSQALKGRTFSEDTKRKMSESKKGENHPNYGKRGKGTPNYGKKFSDEHRKKLSQANNYRKTPVVAIDKNGKVKIFESQTECARKLNVDRSHIYSCLKGKCKTCKGYIIKYVEQLESGIYEGMTGIAE